VVNVAVRPRNSNTQVAPVSGTALVSGGEGPGPTSKTGGGGGGPTPALAGEEPMAKNIATSKASRVVVFISSVDPSVYGEIRLTVNIKKTILLRNAIA
jgi:hypothetical protein